MVYFTVAYGSLYWIGVLIFEKFICRDIFAKFVYLVSYLVGKNYVSLND